MASVTRKSSGVSLLTMANTISGFGNTVAKAGWFETNKYPDGTSVAYVASIQEYGAHFTRFGEKAGDYSVVIPPRPFMRPTVIRETAHWSELIAKGVAACLNGRSTPESVLDKVAARAAGDIAKSISLVQTPPLKQSTIDARRRALTDKKTVGLLTKPLVDTGLMLDSVTHVVEKE